ncbi:MAG: hypothetical protein RLZZ66_1717 [Pseudomonadota bacterium]|jgi:hypothetical protein
MRMQILKKVGKPSPLPPPKNMLFITISTRNTSFNHHSARYINALILREHRENVACGCLIER